MELQEVKGSRQALENELQEVVATNRALEGQLEEVPTQVEALAAEVAQTPSKVSAAKEEGVADFKKSTEYKKEILEARREEFTKLLLSIVRGLLAQGMSPVVITLAHNSLEAVAHIVLLAGMTLER